MDSEERAQALYEAQGEMAMTTEKFNVKGFMADKEAFDLLLGHISSGYSVKAFVEEVGLPVAATIAINRALVRLKSGDVRYEQYEEARAARALQFAERLLNIVDQVETGMLTPQQASMMTKTLMWLAARLDPKKWSEKIQVDANLKIDSATAHLEAVRQMATMVKEGPMNGAKVIEAEVVDEFESLLD